MVTLLRNLKVRYGWLVWPGAERRTSGCVEGDLCSLLVEAKNAWSSFCGQRGSRGPPQGANGSQQKSWRECRMPRVEEGVWDQPKGFTFIKGCARRESSDEWGPPENLHVLICKIGITISILKGWFKIKLDDLNQFFTYFISSRGPTRVHSKHWLLVQRTQITVTTAVQGRALLFPSSSTLAP